MEDRLLHNRNVLAAKKRRLTHRTLIMGAIRSYFEAEGFIEVSTPVRIKSPAPEAQIDPVPSGEFFLAASPELQMKQLVAAGYEKIYQIGPCFRDGERGSRHLPEFTMLEWYNTGGSLDTLASECRGIISSAAKAVGRFPAFQYQGMNVILDTEWPRLDIFDLFRQHAGLELDANPDAASFELDLVDKVEPALPTNCPVFLKGYPASMASLARLDPADNQKALRMELYCSGFELANGFVELTCPRTQRLRFEQEERTRRNLGKPPFELDEDFLGALEVGLPDCAGMAMGLDRLVMILTDTTVIDDVVAIIQ